ncbi:MAG: TonB-dependent receptor plug domain-containing protein, partial [Bacteroidota bacterium]
MRTFILLFCTTAFGINTGNVFSQYTKLTIDKDQVVTIDAVFDLFKDQTDYTFIYPSDLFKDAPLVALKKGVISANELLKISLSDKGYGFKLKKKKIRVFPGTLPNDEVQAQFTVSGTISDSAGIPLVGANILEKGTVNGVQTDFDGNFTIGTNSPNAILVISYIGFETQEIQLDGTTTPLNVLLNESTSSLDEVVVVGYGTQKKVTLTSSVSQVESEVFENRPVANASRALQGAVSNLVITNSESGGQPGAAPNINIRGFQATNGDGDFEDASPLILVDGIIMDINNINPADIESVSVLKDAAAASIYGSRAAAGAIIITTKSGKNSEGGARVSYNYNFSLTQP